MARIRVTIDGASELGGSPLLMHNERLADPLNPYGRWLSELTGKRKKTERDHEEIARREFLGSGYWAVDNGPGKKVSGPVMPTWNVIRCIQEGAKRHKLGKHVVRALIPVVPQVPVIYDGPEDAHELWKSGLFYLRKGVVISGRRTMRTRPCFSQWKIELELELDLTVLDPGLVLQCTQEAGKYEGLGDNRPQYGRFLGDVVLIDDAAELLVPDLLVETRETAARKSALSRLATDEAAHAADHPNGKERATRARTAAKG